MENVISFQYIYTFILNRVVFKVLSIIKGTVFWNLSNLKKQSLLNKSELEELRVFKLKDLISHATNNVEYYKEYSDIKEIDPYLLLSKFPIIDKEKLIKHNSNLISIKHQKSKLVKCSSSGSSGIRSECYLSKNEIAIDRAIQMLWWEWAGVEFGNPIIQTGMDSKRNIFKKVKDYIFRTTYIHAFKMNENDVNHIFKNIKKTTSICGYASSLYNIADMYNGNDNFNGRIVASVSWGDKLFPHYKKKFYEVFGVEIKETYGCAEGIKMAAQYDLEYMYVMSPNVIIEIVNDMGEKVPDGQMGHILLTSLDRYAMPMIRYKVGDLGILLPKDKYPKNRALSYEILEKVIGRDTDIITLPDDSKLTVHSFTGILEYIEEIKQFRIIQNEKESIIFEYIHNAKFSKGEVCLAIDNVNEQLITMIGCCDFTILFVNVDEIPPSKSGKPQIIVSNLK